MAKFDYFPWIAPGLEGGKVRNPKKGRDQHLQRSGAVVLQALKAKHVQSKDVAIAIWQPCQSASCHIVLFFTTFVNRGGRGERKSGTS